jgi:hypothetical protein
MYKRILTTLVLLVLAIVLVCPAVDSDDAVSTGQHEYKEGGYLLAMMAHGALSTTNRVSFRRNNFALPTAAAPSMLC